VTADVLIVGTGLIGTSLALALEGQVDVALHDRDPGALAVALGRGAGRAWDQHEPARHAVLALPLSAIAPTFVVLHERGVAETWSHVASTQSAVQRDIETCAGDASVLCGSHPMAGSERNGPDAASATLFAGRPWVLCPSPTTSASALRATRRLAKLAGADPVELPAAQHDLAVALVSHLPQVAASALAAVVLAEGRKNPASLDLSGPGLQDSTRIAASDPALWTEILGHNARAVAPLVRALADELHRAAGVLDGLAAGTPAAAGTAEALTSGLRALLVSGNEGRRLVPVKHGEHDSAFAVVRVAVPDRPGQLAGVFVAAAEAGINVEDVRVEHLAGRPRGVIELLVPPSESRQAAAALTAAGWDVVG
jgi:prephenate dehydrogenase